jgi:lipopolysaccharide transport system permease protein
MYSGNKFSISIKEMIFGLVRSRGLVYQLIKRNILGRYRGSMFGLVWSFFHPILMLAVYTIVFSTVFKARWNTGDESKIEFALALFIGMITHGIVAEILNKSPRLIITNVNYVKKVVFPLEILPWVVMGATLFHSFVSLFVWVLFYIAVNHSVNWTLIYLPIVFSPLVILSMGLSWFLASLGVYIRDIGQITGVLATVLLFMSPVFYPASMLPEPYQTLIYLNPLTFIIEQARDVLMWGRLPDWEGLGIYVAVSIIFAWAGYAWFQKTRRGFADVL